MTARRLLDRLSQGLLALAETVKALSVMPCAWAAGVSENEPLVREDVKRWLAVLGADDGRHGLHSLLYAFPEFRALYYHRLASGNAAGALLGRVFSHLYRPTAGLSIQTREIGGGLFIAHGQASCLAAERIGANCHIHHNVTIGWDYRGGRAPIVGNDVFIGTGAVVLGAVTIGDGARIGANAVVLSDVPAGATAVGSPARVLGERSSRRPSVTPGTKAMTHGVGARAAVRRIPGSRSAG